MRLFFYGTLMSRESRGHVLAGLADLVGPATIRGDLYNVGWFPALVPGAGRVRGEVFEVRPGYEAAALAITDRIEGYREGDPFSMYVRRPATATFADGSETVVETYEWNLSTNEMQQIQSGDWRRANDRALTRR